MKSVEITYCNTMETSRPFEAITSCKTVKYQVLEADKRFQDST